MKIIGTERIETDDGRFEVECDEGGVSISEWIAQADSLTHKSGDRLRFTWAEWVAIQTAAAAFTAMLNRPNDTGRTS